MPASKIQNESEVLRWFEEGRTYDWMVAEYKRKYQLDTTPNMWAAFRRRRGLPRRNMRDLELIPWRMRDEHMQAYPVIMLRAVARERAGKNLSDRERRRVKTWLADRERDDTVVHYDADTEQGFFYVPRGEDDRDLIHEPLPSARSRTRNVD